MTTNQRRLVVGAGLFGLLVALYHLDPTEVRWLPTCPLHALTGWNCPGCGTMRALHHLLHGEFSAAWRLNPLALLLGPALAVSVWRGWLGRPVVVWLLLTVVAVFGILRNLSGAPFTLVGP